MLVLDDLHWSDGASIELIAALLRRGPRRAGPARARLPARPGAASGWRRRSRCPASQRIALEPAQRGARRRELLGGARRRGRRGDLPRTAAATRSTSSSSRARGAGRRARRRRARRRAARRRAGRRRGVARRGARRRCRAGRARAARGAPRWPASRSSPTSPPRSPSSPPADGLAALDELLDARPRAPDRGARAASSSATRSCAARSTSRRAAAGGSRRTRAPPPRSPRAAPAPAERAHHVEQSAAPGDEEAIALLLEAGRRPRRRARPAAAARWFEAALRLLPDGDRERQVDVRVALASALRSLGELERCRATLLEAIELLPADATSRGASS